MQKLTTPEMINNPQFDLAAQLAEAGHHLGRALADYNVRSAAEESPKQSTAMVHAFHKLLTLALPHAPVDLLESMIELSAMETARARLEFQADNGDLPSARVLGII